MLWICSLWLLAACCSAAEPIKLEPEPAWVQPYRPDLAAHIAQDKTSNGTHWLLVDRQVRVDAKTRRGYHHFAGRALNQQGVDNLANLSIEIDPSYQSLQLHRLQILRDGRMIQLARGAEMQILQRETDLEASILDGSQTVNLQLHDVRVGDVVEYAYSLTGAHPAFAGIEFDWFSLQWSEPLHQMRVRLLASTERQLQPRSIGLRIEPDVRVQNGLREWRWANDGVPALLQDSDTPSWYDPWPRIEWSEFSDWNAVARWATPLYRPAVANGRLADVAEEIRRSARTAEDRLLHALRWVQAEVRYLGIEGGSGAFVPRAPELVLQRRFGDCKDKTLLLVSLLAALDIEAHAALVHSARIVDDKQSLPTPSRFNHVIVRAKIGQREYWLDPTRAPQMAALDQLEQPDFGLALVVDAGSRALTAMPARRPERREIRAEIDASGGLDAAAHMVVRTTYHGRGAERLREQFSRESQDALLKQYLNFYAKYYPGISSTGPLQVADHAPDNRFEVTERYRVDDFWAREDDKGPYIADVHMPDVLDALAAPSTTQREMPLAVNHPLEVTVRTELRLHDPWPFEPNDATIATPHFQYEQRLEGKKDRFTFINSYRSLSDHVPADAVAEHAKRIQEARDQVGYSFSYNPEAATTESAGSFNWVLAFLGATLLALVLGIAARLNQWDPPPRPTKLQPPLQGLGGWLVLPAIGLIATPPLLLVQGAEVLPALSMEAWARLTHLGGEHYHPAWAPILLASMAHLIAMFAFALLLLWLFFRRRTSLPRLYIAFLCLQLLAAAGSSAVLALADIPDAQFDASSGIEVVQAAIQLLIWGTYFQVSERVRGTFVRRRHAPTTSPLPLAPAL